MASEASIVRNILKHLNEDYGKRVLARKLHGSAYSTMGDPDVYGCAEGKMFVIEVKQPGKKPTDLQMLRLDEWRAAGALAFWTTSWQDATAQVERLLS